MKKDNENKILKSSLSTLLKRFSNTDLIAPLDKEYSTANGRMDIALIDDNHILKKARINETKLENAINVVKDKGITTPLFVVQKGERYEILYPRLTYIAALKLKLQSVPYSLVNLSEEESLVLLATQIRDSKVGNIVELSLLLNCLKKKYKYKQTEIAVMMNQSRPQITNIMRLIKLPEWLLRDISNDKLSFGHARTLSCLNEEQLKEIVPLIYLNDYSVRELEKIVYEKQHSSTCTKNEEKLSKKYNAKVNVRPRQITFTFDNEKDRENFIRKISK